MRVRAPRREGEDQCIAMVGLGLVHTPVNTNKQGNGPEGEADMAAYNAIDGRCVCACVSLLVRIAPCMNSLYAHTYMYVFIERERRTWRRTTLLSADVCVCEYVYVHVCVCMYVRVYVCVCMCLCSHDSGRSTHARKRAHTITHTQPHVPRGFVQPFERPRCCRQDHQRCRGVYH